MAVVPLEEGGSSILLLEAEAEVGNAVRATRAGGASVVSATGEAVAMEGVLIL